MAKGKNYQKSLKQQVYEKFASMRAFGESKHDAKKDGTDKEKIFSTKTEKVYRTHMNQFCEWLKDKYPQCSSLKRAEKYSLEYLKERESRGLSAYTLHTDAAAIRKFYQQEITDKYYYSPPARHRSDVKNSRLPAARDSHFSEEKNKLLCHFAEGTGLRRSELTQIRGGDLFTIDDIKSMIGGRAKADAMLFDGKYQYFIHVRHGVGKGGRERFAPITKYESEIVAKMTEREPDKKVWSHVHNAMNTHEFRARYATDLYNKYARDYDDIPYDRVNAGSGARYKSEVYYCRGDEYGRRLDRVAMELSQKALGHNRIYEFAKSYLREG